MSIPITFQGVSYSVPQTDEEGWDNTMTNYLVALAGLGNVGALVGSVLLGVWKPVDSALAGAATLTPTANWHRLISTGGAVVLDVATAIADGTAAGQILLLTGTSATDTVELQDNANVQLNGNIVLGLHDAILFVWDATVGDWQEIGRRG